LILKVVELILSCLDDLGSLWINNLFAAYV